MINSIAIAASLKNASIGNNGKVSNSDSIAEQLQRLQENRCKNHDQITDEIYERENERYEELYKVHSQYREADEIKNKIAGQELDFSRERYRQLRERAIKNQKLQDDFKKLSYFQYITKDDTNCLGDKRSNNQRMLKGKFTVNMSAHMPFQEKVTAYANEELTYYLYQKGFMMNQLKTSVAEQEAYDEKKRMKNK